MFSGAAVLVFSAALAFFANIICSSVFSKEQFGQIVSFSSSVSILSFGLTFGFGGYYLAHREAYIRNGFAISLFPFFIAIAFSFFWLLFFPSLVVFGYASLLIVTVASNQGMLCSQISGNSFRTAIFQVTPSLVKTSATLGILLPLGTWFIPLNVFDSFNIVLAISAGIALPILLKLIFNYFPQKKFSLSFLPDIHNTGPFVLLSFWASSLLALSYGMAMPPIVAYHYGFEFSAFLGIYYIFWAMNSLAINALIINHLLPMYSKELDNANSRVKLSRNIVLVSGLIGAGSVILVFAGAYIGTRTVWTHYEGLEKFLQVSSIALFFRSMSAGVGVFISFRNSIKLKAACQFLVFLCAIVFLFAVLLDQEIYLAYLISALEVLLLVLFLASFYFTEKKRT